MIKRPNRVKNHRVGEIHLTNEGYNIKIIEYHGAKNVTVEFIHNGKILKNMHYSAIKNGEVKNPNKRIGEVHLTKQGYKVKIIDYTTCMNLVVQFDNGYVVENIQYEHVKDGSIINPFHPSVCNEGYIGVGKYSPINSVKEYTLWQAVISRGYSNLFKKNNPTYKDITVCDDWKCLQNFGVWFENNWKEHMQGWHLDKDILVKGNKIYSPETCCFVPAEINTLFIKANSKRGKHPIGVHEQNGRFIASLSHNKNKGVYLGTFDTANEAFECYKFYKEAYIKEIADIWRPLIGEQVYQAMYNYKVEIND